MSNRSTVASVIDFSGIAFGTSGARGLVEQFSDDVCAAFTVAFLSVMEQRFSFKRVAIGIDRRPSSSQMAAACSAAAQAFGLEVDYYGILPTPALALQSMADNIPGIMITGSHIPFDRNGLKFYRPDGEIDKADEQAILRVDIALPSASPCLPEVSAKARERYITRYLDLFSAQMLEGMRIGLYEHSAAGREICSEILTKLGAEVVSLGRTETFVSIDTEAVSDEDKALGYAWSEEYRLDAILSTDGDGDRPLIADERGEWLRGDILGLLCARYLGIEALAVPVSCNTAIEMSGSFEQVMRTCIGSPYVIEGMKQLNSGYERVAGFEANGGFLLGSNQRLNNATLYALPTRDALLPALTLLANARSRGVALSELLLDLPQRFTASDRIKDYPTERSRSLLTQWASSPEKLLEFCDFEAEVDTLDTIDGLRLSLKDRRIVHLRASGNAPELRCYCEANSEAEATRMVRQFLSMLEAQ